MVRVLSIWALSLLSISSLFAAPGAPRIVQVAPAAGQVGALTNITVTFSEPVTGVAPDDLLVNTIASAGSVTGSGTTYTFTLDQQPPYGTVTISWDEGHSIVDLDVPAERFDQNGAGATWQYTLVDSTAPAIASLTPAAGAGVRQLTQVEVLFTEPVTGVDATDLLVNNSPATGVSISGSGKYIFTFAQPTNGTVQLAWATGHGIRDFAAAANAFAGGSWTYNLDPNLGVPSIRINEFVASNIRGLPDGDTPQETNDWIEIWNYGATPVNLNGFSLTDDRDDPGRWVFPSTNIAPGQFLIVFASAKDRTNGVRLHTNFQLGTDGEYLGLFNAESPRVVITEFGPYPAQRNDISYGYDGTNALKYFATPTPGAANGTSSITGTLPPPHYNVERGYFERPFTLILSTPTPGATIVYTTDGSEPSQGATNVLTYSDPITVDKTTVFRAAAFKAGMLPSTSVTHTYLFLDQVVHQPNRPAGFPTNWGPNTGFTGGVVPADYEMDQDVLRVDPLNTNSAIDSVKMQRLKDGLRELPVLSIVMKTDDIFGTAGLYQRSAIEGGAPGTKPKNKKPCSVEMILPDGTTAFATTCAIDLHGNASRNPIKNPKHGFKLKFKDDFGQGALNYRLFEDSTVEEFDDILLRPDFNSSWRHWSNTDGQGLGARQRERATRIRDAWMKNAQRDMGGLAGNSRFVHLYLNGLYWGTFDITQQPVETFAKSMLGDSGTGFDVVDQGSQQAGNLVAYNAMLALPAANTLTNYNRYHDYLNIPEFADYMLLHFYMGHQDWSTDVNKNWYAMRKRVSGPEGTFRYLAWDGECILLNEDVNRVTVATPPSGLHTKLDDSPEYRLAFADRVHKHMIAPGGALTPAMTRARWAKWQAVMDKPIVAESARWGDYRRDVHQYSEGPYQLYTREAFWVPENARMARYFSNRTATVLGQLTAANMYPRVSAPVFSQQGGRVPRGFGLTMTATNAIYFTTDGSDPRAYGTSAISPTAQTYSTAVTLTNSAIVKARALFGTNWSALNEASFQADTLSVPLRVTEIMYNPIGGDAYEYIELQNVGSVPLNVGNFSLEGISYSFPPNTMLAAGATIVLGSDTSPVNWNSRYPGVSVFGRFDMNLANGGEKIAIRDAAGNVVYSVDYDDENGWPTQADGGGFSLQVVDVFGDPDDPANWRASASQNGTPGTQVSTPPAGPVVINEVMAENITAVPNGNTRPDWIELHNSGASAVNIAGWSLTDDGNPRKFVFPAGTSLPANGYLVVWCDAVTNTTPGLHTGFALGRNGESVFLYNASTARVDSVTFGLQLPDFTVGRVANVWRLTTPTPNAANQAATLGSSTNLVINEWLADAVPGGSDWVELYNRSTSPVSLQGVYVANGDVIFQIASLSFVPAGGFVQLFADEVAGADHLDFKLAAAGGAIVLYDEAGNQQDSVTYNLQAQGVSQGRLPDGSSTIVAFPASSSPGASNYQLNYTGARLNEVLAINESAVTNSGRTPDWVELYNPNASAFALGGMALTTDPDEPAQWIFPAGTSVPANGYLVVWFDDSRTATTTAGAFLNTGRTLDGDSGEVHLVSTNGQVVDSVVYGFQVADLSIGFATPAWTLLASPTPGAANSAAATLGGAANLRINEWMADPSSGNDWLEIYNNSDQAVALEGVFLADTPALTMLTQSPFAPVSFIGARGFIKCVADADISAGRNHTTFSLDGSGEALQIYSESLGVIDTVYFGQQLTDASEGRLPDGGEMIVQFGSTASPNEPNYLPLPRVVISEILTHTDIPLEDAIELHNPSAVAADISGYFLSDSARNLKKYRVPAGTTIPAGGFKVIYQNDLTAGAGALMPFTFDSVRGDAAYLSATDTAGNLTGYRAVAKFGPAANGVSFGRFPTTLGVDYPALSQRTYGVDNPTTVTQFRTGTGAQNAYPAIGPIVLNELAYHPPDIGTNDNTADEYIELHNVTTSAVTLYDAANPTNRWRIRGGVDFDFPAGVTIGARGFALIVSFDPATNTAALNLFRATYGIPTSVPILGPYRGELRNSGESIELYRPDTPQGPGPDAGFVPYLLTDKVEYGDQSPWPFEADGGGASLQRRRAYEYGNEPVNWKGDGPTPGKPNVSASSYVDADNDGLSDSWESANGLSPSNPADANQDADGDGETNGEEFLSGTDPRNGTSVLAAPTITSHPTSSVVVGGEDATFTVAATGSSPLSYKWRFNGRDLPDATSSTLILSEVQRTDAGQYDAVVMNSQGFAISQSATLTVNIPPRFTQHPQSVTINNSNNVTFTVAAVGTGTLRYKWQFNGTDIPGATGPTLTLTNVQVHHSGQYTAVVTDDIASVTSQPATLDVRMRPYFIDGPVSQTVVVGGTATFSVRVAGSTPITYSWRRNNVAFTNISLFDTNCTITLNNVQTNQAGTYNVVVTSPALPTPGVLSPGLATLTVLFTPYITVQPTNQSVEAGTNVVLSVRANGNPPPDYQWLFNGGIIPGATTADLSITSIQPEQAGNYSVRITNSVGSVISAVATLTVGGQGALRVEIGRVASSSVVLRINAVDNASYTIEYQDNLGSGQWQRLQNIAAGPARLVEINDPAAGNQRFYRLRTPALP